MKLNINDYVRVKLTDTDKRELLRQHNELINKIRLRGCSGAELPEPKIDENGHYTAQLWSIMSKLGHLCHPGTEPFDSEIVLVKSVEGDGDDSEEYE